MSIVVGTLTIDLAANTASFAQSMDKMASLSAKTANDIKRSLEKITAAGIAMGAAIATGTAATIKGALDAADELGKMAQAAGTTSETLSTLGYAAKLSNVQNEQLVKGLERLSLASFKAQNGNVQLQRIFQRLGISVTDSNGRLKDSGVLMEQLAVKFSKIGDGAGKTALAQALIGRSGASLIPFLNQYGEKQAEVNDEAHRFGLVLSTSTVEVAAHAHDSLEKLSSIMKGLGFSLLSATLPALDQLLTKLIDISQSADLQGLAAAFGGKVVTAVHLLGDALDFATQHAHALKIALEAIAGLALAKVAIPVIGDLAAGGWEKAASGVGKFIVGIAGLGRVIPVLAEFGGWLKYTASFVGLLAAEEGIGAAASYVLGGAVAAIGGPIGIAVAAIVGLGVVVYELRDATFSLGNTTYEVRDIWNAAWILMKSTVSGVVDWFKGQMQQIKDVWTSVVNWFRSNPIGNFIADDFKDANARLGGYVSSIAGKLTPNFAIDALNKAKDARLSANYTGGYTTHPEQSNKETGTPKPQPDTSGLGKPQKDIFGDEIRKLDLAIETQQKYLSVVGGTPEQIEAATAAEKARAIIVELNNRLTDEGRAKLTAHQQAMISDRVAAEESLKALVDYGKEVVGQQHSADLSIQQARVLALANAQGDEAVRQATVDNAILGLTYNKTAAQLAKMAPELAKLRALLAVKANVDLVEGINRDIFSIEQETDSQKILHDAILGTIDAQRQAEIEAKTYAINQQSAAASDNQARIALIQKRDAMIEQMTAQHAAADLDNARRTLGGPGDEYRTEQENLQNLVEALKAAQNGQLSYFQQMQLNAQQQEMFNKATDQTITLLLREGGAADGVKAFFLDMQKQAQTTASIIFDSLHSTFDKLSETLAEFATTGKNNFAKMFEELGKQTLTSVIKKEMQAGVGALGGALGINLGGILGNQNKPDGSSASSALWVRMASDAGSDLSSFGQPRATNELTSLIGLRPPVNAQNAASDIGPLVNLVTRQPPGTPGQAPDELTDLAKSTGGKGSAADPMYVKTLGAPGPAAMPYDDFGGVDDYATDEMDFGGGTFSSLATKFGGGMLGGLGSGLAKGVSGGLGSVLGLLGNLIPHEEGGSVSPSSAYLVGEKGPEILTGTSGNIISNANSRRSMGSGGDTHTWNIDARGNPDPAQSIAGLNRYMKTAAPQIAAAAVSSVKDQQMRRPPSAK